MRKSVIAWVAALAVVLGTGALVEPAQAAYPNTVRTTAKINRSGSTTEGRTFRVGVRVSAGNATINGGKVTIRFAGTSHTKSVSKGLVVFSVKAPKVSKTKLVKMTAKYYRASGSIFRSSSTTSKLIKVKNR